MTRYGTSSFADDRWELPILASFVKKQGADGGHSTAKKLELNTKASTLDTSRMESPPSAASSLSKQK